MPSVMYIDMAYTYARMKARSNDEYYHARHSGDLFEKVWGVHPLADLGGSPAKKLEIIAFSPGQTVIEGVSRSRNWPRLLAPLDFVLSQLQLFRLLARIIRQEDVSIIVVNDPFYSGLLGLALKIRCKRPLVVSIYANYDLAYDTSRFIAMPRLMPWFWLQNLIAEGVLKRADLVISGNRNNLGWALDHGAREEATGIVPVSRFVQSFHLTPPEQRQTPDEDLTSLGVPLGRRYLIMVSRLLDVKMADDGVRAMKLAVETAPDVIGLVAGDGPMRAELEELVRSWGLEDRILFLGQLDQETLSRILPRCITISPVTGLALIESALAGSPAVAYDADWQAEFIDDGIDGFIVPPGEHQALGQRAIRLLEDPGLTLRFARAIRAKAAAFCDSDTIHTRERLVFEPLLRQGTTTAASHKRTAA